MDIHVINNKYPYNTIDKNYLSKNILITTIDKLLDKGEKGGGGAGSQGGGVQEQNQSRKKNPPSLVIRLPSVPYGTPCIFASFLFIILDFCSQYFIILKDQIYTHVRLYTETTCGLRTTRGRLFFESWYH